MRFGFQSAVLLVVGGALGFWLGSVGDASQETEVPKSVKSVDRRQTDEDMQRRLQKLRQRIAELERQLAQREVRTAESNDVPPAVAAAPAEPHRRNPLDWLDNIRKTDPARYTQMTNRFANWRQRRMNQAREKIDFLSSVDTSHMSNAAQETHQALQDLIAQCEDLESRLQQPEISNDERLEIMNELRTAHRDMRRLNGAERQNLLAETVRVLGFDGDEAKEVTSVLQDVIRATDSGFGRGPGGPR